MASDFQQKAQTDRPGLVHAGRKIEEESFRIIDAEMGPHGFPPAQWQVLRRIIHTTGDFDYGRWVRFHPLAVEAGCSALRGGATIFTDTRMIQTGLSPWRLNWFGTNVITPVSVTESQEWAEQMGTTRSVAASSKNDYSLAFEIVREYLPDNTPIDHLGFPMTFNSERLENCMAGQ